MPNGPTNSAAITTMFPLRHVAYWSRSLESDATVRADYALTTTANGSEWECKNPFPVISKFNSRGVSIAAHGLLPETETVASMMSKTHIKTSEDYRLEK